jgi:hypothetical protein
MVLTNKKENTRKKGENSFAGAMDLAIHQIYLISNGHAG